jgi:[acyl-carrier-protein] S-malonyltransferase
MFSLLFPGQGSQIVGMGKEFYENFDYVKDLFQNADEIFKKKISKIILEGPGELLNQTENTQTAIFLISFSIFQVLEKETNLNIKNAQFYAGHSLGEYSALCCAGSINFEQTINLLKSRGMAMQNAVPKGEGGMIAVLGVEINKLNEILSENSKFECFVANDNSPGQIVISGKLNALEIFEKNLKEKNIKVIKLPVSAPFHCPLMKNATQEMKNKILDTEFKNPLVPIISNVTASPQNKSEEIKKLLIKQIENPVRWRESIINMIDNGVKSFIEIGPGKVLSGLVKRIDRNVKLNQVNNLIDIKNITND